MMSTPPNKYADAPLLSVYRSGDLGRSLQMAQAILKNEPDHGEANLILAQIRLRQGLWTEAEAAGNRAVSARPGDETPLLLMSNIHGARGHTEVALKWCDKVLAANGSSRTALGTKAQLLERAGNWQGALDTLNSSEVPVSDPAWALLRARCLLCKKEPEAAAAAIDEGLSLWGMDVPSAAAMRARLLLVRAKAMDALHRYDEAFEDAASANKVQAVSFDPKTYVDDIDHIIQIFTAERVQRTAAYPGAPVILGRTGDVQGKKHRHVFIAGMPRSGTTLVEQILDAHPDATGVGEAKELDICARNLQEILGYWTPWPACVDGLTPEFRRKLADSYEQAMLSHGFSPSGTFVNKNLKNLRLIGLIAMLFPDAKIIFTHRDPRDVGLSCFMGNFSTKVHPELHDLDHIALAIQQHERLIDHWKSVLGLQWMDVQYEDLISDQDRITREIVEFCDLPWDDRCLRFYESGRTVMTLSYDQVNKPMYTSSVGRYGNYEHHIGPLMKLASD